MRECLRMMSEEREEQFTLRLHTRLYCRAVVFLLSGRPVSLAAVALVIVGSGIFCGSGGATNNPPTIPVIERNLANALTESNRLILRVHKHRTRTPAYVTAVKWVNLANGQTRTLDYDASGRLKTDTSASATSSVKATGSVIGRTWVTVNHELKTWSKWKSNFECGKYCTVPPPPTGSCGCDLDPFTNFQGETPHIALLGQETIDGEPTFHLRFTIASGNASTTDIWIDRLTYLPVHEKVAFRNTSVEGHPTITTINDFTWLPHNRTNLTHFMAVVPSGFKRVSANP
jgi:YD repeat-containing protein